MKNKSFFYLVMKVKDLTVVENEAQTIFIGKNITSDVLMLCWTYFLHPIQP